MLISVGLKSPTRFSSLLSFLGRRPCLASHFPILSFYAEISAVYTVLGLADLGQIPLPRSKSPPTALLIKRGPSLPQRMNAAPIPCSPVTTFTLGGTTMRLVLLLLAILVATELVMSGNVSSFGIWGSISGFLSFTPIGVTPKSWAGAWAVSDSGVL